MKILLLLLLGLSIQTAHAYEETNTIRDFFHETFKETQAVFSGHMDDRKTLVEVVGEAWQGVWR